jgi:flavin-dependent dehydrogenase
MFNRFLAQLAESNPSLDPDQLNKSLKGAPIRTGLTGSRLYGDGIVAIGESIGVTYPFIGEGIGKSLESAEVAAEVISDAVRCHNFSSQFLMTYQSLMDFRFRRKYETYSSAQRWLNYPFVLNLISDRARKKPLLRRRLEGILAERQDPTEVFSILGLLKAVASC